MATEIRYQSPAAQIGNMAGGIGQGMVQQQNLNRQNKLQQGHLDTARQRNQSSQMNRLVSFLTAALKEPPGPRRDVLLDFAKMGAGESLGNRTGIDWEKARTMPQLGVEQKNPFQIFQESLPGIEAGNKILGGEGGLQMFGGQYPEVAGQLGQHFGGGELGPRIAEFGAGSPSAAGDLTRSEKAHLFKGAGGGMAGQVTSDRIQPVTSARKIFGGGANQPQPIGAQLPGEQPVNLNQGLVGRARKQRVQQETKVAAQEKIETEMTAEDRQRKIETDKRTRESHGWKQKTAAYGAPPDTAKLAIDHVKKIVDKASMAEQYELKEVVGPLIDLRGRVDKLNERREALERGDKWDVWYEADPKTRKIYLSTNEMRKNKKAAEQEAAFFKKAGPILRRSKQTWPAPNLFDLVEITGLGSADIDGWEGMSPPQLEKAIRVKAEEMYGGVSAEPPQYSSKPIKEPRWMKGFSAEDQKDIREAHRGGQTWEEIERKLIAAGKM